MSGKAIAREQKELLSMIAKDEKLKNIHTLLFLPPQELLPDDTLVEQAYVRHLTRLKKLIRLKG